MCAHWGISLLHKHWLLRDQEIPVQYIRGVKPTRELVTIPKSDVPDNYLWPRILAARSDLLPPLEPIEFTTDKSAAIPCGLLESSQGFTREFAATVTRNGLVTTFGLCLRQEPADAEMEWIEFNYSGRVSVLKETISAETDRKSLIETSWYFVPDVLGATCKSKCLSGCTVGGSGGHSHSHSDYHDPNG